MRLFVRIDCSYGVGRQPRLDLALTWSTAPRRIRATGPICLPNSDGAQGGAAALPGDSGREEVEADARDVLNGGVEARAVAELLGVAVEVLVVETSDDHRFGEAL